MLNFIFFCYLFECIVNLITNFNDISMKDRVTALSEYKSECRIILKKCHYLLMIMHLIPCIRFIL